VVVELEHEHYQRLVIEVADPEEVVRTLQSATAGAPPDQR
jgi:hypothetical protein